MNNNEWITDRLPTLDEWYVYDHDGCIVPYRNICTGEAWKPIPPCEPYVKPKRWVLDWSVSGDCWILKDTQKVYTATLLNMCIEGDDSETDKERTREAAERIATIYEEVMP